MSWSHGVTDVAAVPVHIVGTDITTEEQEPEFFVCSTVVVPPLQVVPAIQLDPMRKSMAISSPDGICIICHAFQQAESGSNLIASAPYPEGAFLPAGGSIGLDGTGPLWIVNPSATQSIRVSIVQNRRERLGK